METSLGIIETKGFAAAIAATEKILEDKSIGLIRIEKTGGGIISVFFRGSTELLKAAFEKGIQQARLVCEIVAIHIFNDPNNSIGKLLFDGDRTTAVIAGKREIVQEKITARETEAKKSKVQKIVKVLKELPTAEKKVKSSKFLGTTSTIQRLRREALSTAKFSNEKDAAAKIREEKISSQVNISKIEKLNVHELRRLARSTNGFPIQGREISKANRKDLVNYFRDLA